jgi:uncharacterized protein DUF3467
MTAEKDTKVGNPIPTEGFPVVYSNLASITVNYNDVRIYFADTQAKEIVTAVMPSPVQIKAAEATVAPRICLVLTPEFGKSLLDALAQTLSQYELQFGPLRPRPQAPEQAKQ